MIGIEYVPEAIEDAKINSQENHIDNTLFYAGDMKDILTDEFIAEHGRPDVIITDPPRAGMHPDVVKTILQASFHSVSSMCRVTLPRKLVTCRLWTQTIRWQPYNLWICSRIPPM